MASGTKLCQVVSARVPPLQSLAILVGQTPRSARVPLGPPAGEARRWSFGICRSEERRAGFSRRGA